MSDEETKTTDEAEVGPGQDEHDNNGDDLVNADWQIVWSPDDVLSMVFSIGPKDKKNTTIGSVTATFAAARRDGVVTHSFAGADVRATTELGEGQQMAGNLGFDAAGIRAYHFGEDQVLQAILAGTVLVRDELPRNFFFTKVVAILMKPAQPPEEEAADDSEE